MEAAAALELVATVQLTMGLRDATVLQILFHLGLFSGTGET